MVLEIQRTPLKGEMPASAQHIILIPGIGGHPIFHRNLAETLACHGNVYVAEHGDFHSRPYTSLSAHTLYWRRLIESLGPSRKLLVGVSFGSYIAVDLLNDPPPGLAGIVLISHWPVGPAERALLRVLDSLPRRFAATLLGRLLFRWSEITADDAAQLRRLRQELYDTKENAYQRLLGRLLCLVKHRYDLCETIRGLDSTLLFGDREWVIFFKKKLLLRTVRNARARMVIIRGDHSISIKKDAGLSLALEHILIRLGFEKTRDRV